MVQLSHSLFSNQEKLHPRLHAKNLDKVLGFRIPKIELKLLQKYRAYDQTVDESSRKKHYEGSQAWIGLHPQALQTPYSDIYKAFSALNIEGINCVVDIGAGYGRVGLVLSVLNPNAKFIGFEMIKRRQSEASRVFDKFGLYNSTLVLQDVLNIDFHLPKADVYFIYDFSDREDITQILLRLETLSKESPFYIISKGENIDLVMKNKFAQTWKILKEFNSSGLKIYCLK